MKNLFFCLLLLVSGALVQAQVIELEEAKVNFYPEVEDNTFHYVVNENYSGEFSKDPIAFMKANFDIQDFMLSVKDRNYDSYEVTFTNKKGYFEARFSKDGELLDTRQEFKNIAVPPDIREELYRSHKGWAMVKNKYSARGTADVVEKELYKIKLERGKDKKNIKLDPRTLRSTEVVSLQ